MKKANPLYKKAVLIVALLFILMCPFLFIGGKFFPTSIGFLEPILCPSGMHFNSVSESLSDLRGNVTASYLVCTDGREQVDATGKMLIILFGVAILGVGLLITWALIGPNKEPEEGTKFNIE